VVAVMKGSEAPDQWVVRGNHHDGWVMGANDPLSGNVALMSEAKAIGALVKSGWRPKRTLVYASWDAEEPGLIGSTEWAETHDAELQRKAVVYINSDSNGRGFLSVEGSHDLQRLVNQASAEVNDPERGVSVRDRERAALAIRVFNNPSDQQAKAASKKAGVDGDLPIGPLGSGSDYTAFEQHLGVPSLNVGFGGESEQGGVYHSLYDDFEHYLRFGDPQFVYGVALSQTAGRLALRTANADVLPYAFEPMAETLTGYVEELKKLLGDSREKGESTNKLVKYGVFEVASDPTLVSVAPPLEDAPPKIDFNALDQATAKLKASARAYDEALAAAGSLAPAKRQALNTALQQVAGALLDPEGLPGRPWFRNLAYAPGVLTGYGSKTLPGVREAIESRRWAEAQTYVAKTAEAIARYAERIDAATALLKKA